MSNAPSSRRHTASARRRLRAVIVSALIVLPLVVIAAVLARTNGGAQQDAPLPSAAFTNGNLVVYRVGTGSAALASSATAVFLDEYTTAGGSPVQSIAMPTAASGGNHILTASGTATTEGLLTRSTDGQYLMLTGYDAALGTASITSSASATVNRVIGRVDAAGNINTTTALNDAATGSNPRSATSTNGTDLWISGGAGGVRYTTLGSTTSTQLSTTVTNLRQANIFGGQLYVSTQSGTAVRLGTVGTGTPPPLGRPSRTCRASRPTTRRTPSSSQTWTRASPEWTRSMWPTKPRGRFRSIRS